MEIYLALFMIIIIIASIIFYKGNTPKSRIIFLIISFSLIFLIMGFRGETVGTDTKLYCTIFENNFDFNLKGLIEEPNLTVIYDLYNKIISLISTDRRAIIISNSLIICILTATFIYNNSKNVVFSTLSFMTFYHFFSAMNISRQYIAILVFANAFIFLKKKLAKKYLITCLIATLIHNTAIVSFLLVPYLYIKPNKKNILIYLTIITISLFFSNEIMILFSKIFPHYDMYFNNQFLKEVGQNRKIIITLIYIVFALLTNFLIKKNKIPPQQEREIYLLHIINYLTIILGFLSLKIMLISRIEAYFSIFAIIFIPKIFNLLKDKIMYYFLFTIIMIIPMYMQLKSNNNGILPYTNWLITFLN